ncbi:hypothetical protein [Plantibacter sp. YIM 135347]|uniref:hypothetical protein n=1 Tax=Plantibacter sp. YIM 135347 TaxID=3423919 RepID=UPI003D34C181
MPRLKRIVGVVAALVLLSAGLVVGGQSSTATAASASDFRAGNLISDELFFDGGAMSAGDVQNFLNGASGACRAGYTCLKSYGAATPSRGAVSGRCAAYAGSPGESAASIIAKVGAACGISQKVLMVMLEKEQSLITDTWPSDRQYRSAMGYGCPDTADCDTNYYGFFNQVYAAALQFKNYAGNPGRWNHVAGRVNAIRYNPDASCGSSNVYIENQATAGLYNYTPYQPNASALANLYGQGDGCGAYGNRNFWRIYTDWFGSTQTVQNPVGALDQFSATVNEKDGVLNVNGWTLDLTQKTTSIQAHVYITAPNGTKTGYPIVANQSRPDIAAAYPGAGANHGYKISVPITAGGTYQVCVFGIGSANNRQIGCGTTVVEQRPPRGEVDIVKPNVTNGSATVQVEGWAVETDALTKSIPVHVYAVRSDGRQWGYAITANQSRPDIAAAYPGAGPAHGYKTSIPITEPGLYNVCAYGIATSWRNLGANSNLGCRPVNLISDFPTGRFDGATLIATDSGSSIRATGWVVDTGAPEASIPVHVYITDPDGKTVGSAKVADKQRDDVNNAINVTGAHGFDESFPVTKSGVYNVCTYGIAVSPLSIGKNTTLGCKQVSVTGLPVTGALDQVSVSSVSNGVATVDVRGWGLDRQTPTASIPVHIYYTGSNGVPVGKAFTAANPRPDIANAFPGAGDAHGFAEQLKLPAPGTYRVCAYAIGVAPLNIGNNPIVGCRDVSY